jgi:hypothetical protein
MKGVGLKCLEVTRNGGILHSQTKLVCGLIQWRCWLDCIWDLIGLGMGMLSGAHGVIF